MRQFGILLAAFTALFVAGCGGDSVKSPDFRQVLQSVQIAPQNPTVPAGTTQQFTAVGVYSLPPGSSPSTETRPLEGVTWGSSNTSRATIDENGLAAAIGQGTVTITATADGVQGSTTLTVGAPALVSLDITPSSATVAVDRTQTLTATGTFTDGSTDTVAVTWTTNDAAIVSVNAGPSETTVATGVAQGVATVRATSGSVFDTVTVTVRPRVVSLEVVPDPGTSPAGRPIQFGASGIIQTGQGTTITGSTADGSISGVTWSVANLVGDTNPAPVANIDASLGIATGLRVGSAAVTASVDGVSDTAQFDVTPAVLDRIVITPANPSLAVGATVGLTANGLYTDGRLEPVSADWTLESSSDPGIVSFDPNPATTTQLRGEVVGNGVIRASLETDNAITGVTEVTVTEAVLEALSRIVPASARVNPGRSVEFTLLGTFTGGVELPIDDSLVTWTSGTTAIATIDDATGIATGVAEGQSTITATATGISGSQTATLFVTESQCTTPLLSADGAQVTELATGLCVGCTVQNDDRIVDGSEATFGTLLLPVGLSNQATLSATVTAGNNANYNLPFAGGNNAGFVIGRPAGLLSAEVLERIQVSTLLEGVVQETSGDSELLRVDLLGLQLLGGGEASDLALVSLQTSVPYDAVRISVVSGVAAVLTDVQVFQACGTVTPPVQPDLVGLTRIDPVAATVVAGQARNLVVYGTVGNGAEVEIADADLNWTSSNEAVATVDANGVVTAHTAGDATITATLKSTVPASGSQRTAVSNITVTARACTVPFSDLNAVAAGSTGGICLFCNVANAPAAADGGPGSLLTAATVSVPVGLLGANASVSVLTPIGTQPLPGGDFTGFVLSRPLNPLLQLELLDSIEISTLRRTLTGVQVVETRTAASQTSTPLRLGLLGLELTGENQLVLAGFRASQPYDGIRVTFNGGVASALSNFAVFESCASAVEPVE